MLQGHKLLPALVNTLKISTAVFNEDHVCEGRRWHLWLCVSSPTHELQLAESEATSM